MFTNNYDSSFCFWVFEKKLTQENCFLFCKKYGLFNGFIFLTIKKIIITVLLSKISWSAFDGRGGGGGESKYFVPEAELFQLWRGFFQGSIHKQFYSK